MSNSCPCWSINTDMTQWDINGTSFKHCIIMIILNMRLYFCNDILPALCNTFLTFDIHCIFIYGCLLWPIKSLKKSVCLLTRQKVVKVIGVGENPILAAKWAICFILSVNWLQFSSFILSGHADLWFIRSDVTNGGKKQC